MVQILLSGLCFGLSRCQLSLLAIMELMLLEWGDYVVAIASFGMRSFLVRVMYSFVEGGPYKWVFECGVRGLDAGTVFGGMGDL